MFESTYVWTFVAIFALIFSGVSCYEAYRAEKALNRAAKLIQHTLEVEAKLGA